MEQSKSAKPLIAVVHSWGVERPVERVDGETFSVSDMEDARAALKWADGIILTGGGDVNPQKYADFTHPEVYGVDTQRDKLEFFIARKAREKNIPIMGICRGHQLLNVAYGGTLNQHIKDSYTEKSHWGGMHMIRIRAKSTIGRFLDRRTMWGTSLHHQAIDRMGTGLIATGWTEDGHIEMIESIPGLPHYVLGVQFHPEMDYHSAGDLNPSLGIFRHFVQVASMKARRRRLTVWERQERAIEDSGQKRIVSAYNYRGDYSQGRGYSGYGGGFGDSYAGPDSRWEGYEDWWGDARSEDEAVEKLQRQTSMTIESVYDPIRKIWIPRGEWDAEDELIHQSKDDEIIRREDMCDAQCAFPPCVHPWQCDPYEGDCFARAIAEDRANHRVGTTLALVRDNDELLTRQKRGNGRDHERGE